MFIYRWQAAVCLWTKHIPSTAFSPSHLIHWTDLNQYFCPVLHDISFIRDQTLSNRYSNVSQHFHPGCIQAWSWCNLNPFKLTQRDLFIIWKWAFCEINHTTLWPLHQACLQLTYLWRNTQTLAGFSFFTLIISISLTGAHLQVCAGMTCFTAGPN